MSSGSIVLYISGCDEIFWTLDLPVVFADVNSKLSTFLGSVLRRHASPKENWKFQDGWQKWKIVDIHLTQGTYIDKAQTPKFLRFQSGTSWHRVSSVRQMFRSGYLLP